MSAPWVAYLVVGLALSMIASVGIALISLARKSEKTLNRGKELDKIH